jgi:uncharacterized protein YfaA (DUF2138 family)
MQALAQVYGERVVEFNTASKARMAPATDAFYAAVAKNELVWDGNQTLRTHILSAVARRTPVGDVISKDARLPVHIDAAVSAILAHEAARQVLPPVPVAIW